MVKNMRNERKENEGNKIFEVSREIGYREGQMKKNSNILPSKGEEIGIIDRIFVQVAGMREKRKFFAMEYVAKKRVSFLSNPINNAISQVDESKWVQSNEGSLDRRLY